MNVCQEDTCSENSKKPPYGFRRGILQASAKVTDTLLALSIWGKTYFCSCYTRMHSAIAILDLITFNSYTFLDTQPIYRQVALMLIPPLHQKCQCHAQSCGLWHAGGMAVQVNTLPPFYNVDLTVMSSEKLLSVSN